MEPDRYHHNQKDYIIGIICLICSLTLFAFSAYITPYLAFDWHYLLPDFISHLMHILQSGYRLRHSVKACLVFAIFFIPAVILVIIADVASNRIDNKIHGIKPHRKTR